jgi:hypothetical protein
VVARFPKILSGNLDWVTDGLALLAAWLEFLAMLGALAYFVLRRSDPG